MENIRHAFFIVLKFCSGYIVLLSFWNFAVVSKQLSVLIVRHQRVEALFSDSLPGEFVYVDVELLDQGVLLFGEAVFSILQKTITTELISHQSFRAALSEFASEV
jgi:hypothetical protein